MPRAVRWIGRGLLLLILLAAIGLGGGYLWLRGSLPQIDGRIEVAGLAAPVTVVRDRHAIPHIEAADLADATFALGFVHAQDRLWQMEFQRRLGAGRLAEIIGEATLPADRFMRVLGLYRQSEASLAHLEPRTIAMLEAYAAGVNGYLQTRDGPLPPEFLILGHHQLEPWTPADSLVWIRMMALDLSGNWRAELLRARLAKRLSKAQIADLWPGYPDFAPITLAELARELPADDLAAVLPPAPPPGQGSNAWVVAGSRTATGAPLLANDPHLGLRAPGVWYLAHLATPETDVIGATLPGVPAVVLGQNRQIAWGFTNTGSDVQDLFVERIDPADSSRYLTPEGSAPFDVREEVIRVKGAAPETLRVRATRHGPVLSDLLPDTDGALEDDQVLALAWTALAADDTSLETLLELNRAHDWLSFEAAMRNHVAPQQNVVYADVGGMIGFVAPGRVPLRHGDGRWPVPGWTGDYDWRGFIPFEDLPRAVDPPSGVFANANNRIVPEDYPYLLTADWDSAYRARRILQSLDGEAGTLGGFAALQADQLSLLAADLLPIMLAVEPLSDEAGDAMARLRRWDRVMYADAPEPLVFAAWYRELSRLIYADELGDLFTAYWGIRPRFMASVLQERPVWCDDIATASVEDCEQMAARALDQALADLRARFGDDPGAWRWGRAHPARMGHAIFKDQPLLARWFNIEIPTGGDSTTVNVGHYAIVNEARPFASIHAASYRGLYDLADLDRSRFVTTTGQSGNPLSGHYRDLSQLWVGNQTVPMMRRPEVYAEGAIGRLELRSPDD